MNPSPFEYLVAFFQELERIMPSSDPRHAITLDTVENGPGVDQGELVLQRNVGDCYFPVSLTKEMLDLDPLAAARAVAKAAEEEFSRHPDRIFEYR
jgi:hypothetical protein